MYIGWTWRGFLLDYKVILTFLALLSPPFLFLWSVYRRSDFHGSLLTATRRVLVPPLLNWTVLIELVFLVILFLFVWSKPSQIPEDLLYNLKQHNWEYAGNTLDEIRKKPVREDLIFSLSHYVDSHKRSNGNNFETGQFHRGQRIAVKRALDKRDEYYYLNLLSFAELSKIIYFVEDRNSSELGLALKLLAENATTEDNLDLVGNYYLKIGDLKLAQKDYSGALSAYELSKPYLTDPSSLAICNANIGNIKAADGKHEQAALLYREAEAHYPEGRRDVFYSNFGYLLMLGGQLDEAESAVRNALSINPEDWYSYLNIALIYDAKGLYDDAIYNYNKVISQTKAGDFLREAKLLKAYSLLKGKNSEEEAVRLILDAIGRSPGTASQIISDPIQLADIYTHASKLLTKTNTHGIEIYINYFNEMAEKNLTKASKGRS